MAAQLCSSLFEMLAPQEMLATVDHPRVVDAVTELVAAVAEPDHRLVRAHESAVIKIYVTHCDLSVPRPALPGQA